MLSIHAVIKGSGMPSRKKGPCFSLAGLSVNVTIHRILKGEALKSKNWRARLLCPLTIDIFICNFARCSHHHHSLVVEFPEDCQVRIPEGEVSLAISEFQFRDEQIFHQLPAGRSKCTRWATVEIRLYTHPIQLRHLLSTTFGVFSTFRLYDFI
jgi:hypothetical protein